MPAGLVLYVAVGNTAHRQRTVEQDGIAPVDNGVVLAVDEENGRTVGRYVQFKRERVAQLAIVLAVVAKQGAARALVGAVCRH